jgi:hypothetical protein
LCKAFPCAWSRQRTPRSSLGRVGAKSPKNGLRGHGVTNSALPRQRTHRICEGLVPNRPGSRNRFAKRLQFICAPGRLDCVRASSNRPRYPLMRVRIVNSVAAVDVRVGDASFVALLIATYTGEGWCHAGRVTRLSNTPSTWSCGDLPRRRCSLGHCVPHAFATAAQRRRASWGTRGMCASSSVAKW